MREIRHLVVWDSSNCGHGIIRSYIIMKYEGV